MSTIEVSATASCSKLRDTNTFQHQTFESTLKDVVNAKRLSASKMSTLTDIALKCMKVCTVVLSRHIYGSSPGAGPRTQNDTQLVSTLFRTHRTLSPAAKVNSLYVFDALSRAARNQVNKHRLAPPSDPSQGNCATFIVKVEGILDSLWQDLLSTRDETLKVSPSSVTDKTACAPAAKGTTIFGSLLVCTDHERVPRLILPCAHPATCTATRMVL